MRTLVLVLIAVGVLFGAVEVAVTAAAEPLGSDRRRRAAARAVGRRLARRRRRRRPPGGGAPARRPRAPARRARRRAPRARRRRGQRAALGAVLLVAGAAIAPTYAAVYALVDDAAPAGTVTEAFAWLATAIAIGAAAGAAIAGALADHAGPAAAFVLAGAAGAIALLTTLLRAPTLPGREVAVLPVAVPVA